jgi:hypothetical protein
MIRRSALVTAVAVTLVAPALAQAIDLASDGSSGHEAPQRVLPVSSATGERYSGEANGGDEAELVPVAARNRHGTGVPTLDVSSTCRAAADLHLTDGEGYRNCMSDETQAQDQLRKNWSSYSSAIRTRCMAEATIGGNPSYIDLFECLDMAKYASQLEANGDNPKMTRPPQTTGSIKRRSLSLKGARTEPSAPSAAIRIPSESDLDRAREIDPKILQSICRGC